MPCSVSLIDGDARIREELCRLLDPSPDFVCVEVFPDAESALRVFTGAGRCPDFVILELRLPGLSGLDCLIALKRMQPAPKILVRTHCIDPRRVFAALEAGADGYVLKTGPFLEVLDVLCELRAGGAPLSGAVGRLLLERIHGTATGPRSSGLEGLTQREREVLEQLALGRSSKEIAAILDISRDTVAAHLKHIYQKLGVRSRLEAVLRRLRAGPLLQGKAGALRGPGSSKADRPAA